MTVWGFQRTLGPNMGCHPKSIYSNPSHFSNWNGLPLLPYWSALFRERHRNWKHEPHTSWHFDLCKRVRPRTGWCWRWKPLSCTNYHHQCDWDLCYLTRDTKETSHMFIGINPKQFAQAWGFGCNRRHCRIKINQNTKKNQQAFNIDINIGVGDCKSAMFFGCVRPKVQPHERFHNFEVLVHRNRMNSGPGGQENPEAWENSTQRTGQRPTR